jgi:hypothetical protein
LDSDSNRLSSDLERKDFRNEEPSNGTEANLISSDVDEHGGEDDDLEVRVILRWREGGGST